METEDLKQRIVALEAVVAALLAERGVEHELGHEDRHDAIIDLATEHAEAVAGKPGGARVSRLGAIAKTWADRLTPDGLDEIRGA